MAESHAELALEVNLEGDMRVFPFSDVPLALISSDRSMALLVLFYYGDITKSMGVATRMKLHPYLKH